MPKNANFCHLLVKLMLRIFCVFALNIVFRFESGNIMLEQKKYITGKKGAKKLWQTSL